MGSVYALREIDRVSAVVSEKDTPFFVCCLSGARSRQAVGALVRMGYLDIKNIGGIAAYTRKVDTI